MVVWYLPTVQAVCAVSQVLYVFCHLMLAYRTTGWTLRRGCCGVSSSLINKRYDWQTEYEEATVTKNYWKPSLYHKVKFKLYLIFFSNGIKGGLFVWTFFPRLYSARYFKKALRRCSCFKPNIHCVCTKLVLWVTIVVVQTWCRVLHDFISSG